MVRRLNDYVSMMRSHCSPNCSEIAKDGWLAYARPGGAYWAPKLVRSLWKAKEIFITENGCASDDVVADDGKVYDTDRIMFLRSQLEQLQRATADGVPVKGFLQWITMDNFEWNAGFSNRFGLFYVDFETQKRTPKLSADWFREAVARNHSGVAIGKSALAIMLLLLTDEVPPRTGLGSGRPGNTGTATTNFDTQPLREFLEAEG